MRGIGVALCALHSLHQMRFLIMMSRRVEWLAGHCTHLHWILCACTITLEMNRGTFLHTIVDRSLHNSTCHQDNSKYRQPHLCEFRDLGVGRSILLDYNVEEYLDGPWQMAVDHPNSFLDLRNLVSNDEVMPYISSIGLQRIAIMSEDSRTYR